MCVSKTNLAFSTLREKLDKSRRLERPLGIFANDSVPPSADMFLTKVILLVSVAFTIVGQCEAKSRNIKFGVNQDIHDIFDSTSRVKWVNVNPCNQTPCVLDASQSYNVTMKLVAQHSAIGVNMSMTFKLDGRKTYWMYHVNMCRFLLQDASCPLRAQQTVYFSFPLTLPTKTMTPLPKLLYVSMVMMADRHHIFKKTDSKYKFVDINTRFMCDMRD